MDIDVTRIAKIARLNLTKDEIQRFGKDAKDILDAFGSIKDCPTKDISPCFHPIPLHDAVREDTTAKSLTTEEATSLTIHKKDGYFKGPKAIQ